MKFLYTAHITKSHGGLLYSQSKHEKRKIEGQTTTPGTTSPTLANSVWVL